MPVLTLPRLGETMESGRVVGWLKHPGDAFRRGETLVEIESDKTVVELPALADGVLREILAAEGRDIDVGAALCRYDGGGEDAPPPSPQPSPSGRGGKLPLPPGEYWGEGVPATDRLPATDRPRATPVARRLAASAGLSLADLAGTGRRGRIEARDVRAAGGGLAVRDWTPATPPRGRVVLLHGFGGDAQTWGGLAHHLVRVGWAASAPDLPGHGATSMPADSIDGVVAAAIDWLRTLDGAPLNLVGHSLGGVVAALAARAMPERIARLTLIAPAGLGDAIDADFVHGIAHARTGGGLAHLLRRLTVRPPPLSPARLDEMARALAAGRLAALADALAADGRQQIDILPVLAALPMPVRVVWGLEDRIIPWTQAALVGSRIALHLVQGAGHMAHWDKPEEVAALFA